MSGGPLIRAATLSTDQGLTHWGPFCRLVRAGRARDGGRLLTFRNGSLRASQPISDGDFADYLADCLEDNRRWNRVLPIGGPGEAITPCQQGEALFAMLGRNPRFRRVPVALLDGIITALNVAGHLAPSLADKAELARIGRYYATELMLLLNPETGRYDAPPRPRPGPLFDFYLALVSGSAAPKRWDHAVFSCVRGMRCLPRAYTRGTGSYSGFTDIGARLFVQAMSAARVNQAMSARATAM